MPKYGQWGQEKCQTHFLHFWTSELQKTVKISLLTTRAHGTSILNICPRTITWWIDHYLLGIYARGQYITSFAPSWIFLNSAINLKCKIENNNASLDIFSIARNLHVPGLEKKHFSYLRIKILIIEIKNIYIDQWLGKW